MLIKRCTYYVFMIHAQAARRSTTANYKYEKSPTIYTREQVTYRGKLSLERHTLSLFRHFIFRKLFQSITILQARLEYQSCSLLPLFLSCALCKITEIKVVTVVKSKNYLKIANGLKINDAYDHLFRLIVVLNNFIELWNF